PETIVETGRIVGSAHRRGKGQGGTGTGFSARDPFGANPCHGRARTRNDLAREPLRRPRRQRCVGWRLGPQGSEMFFFSFPARADAVAGERRATKSLLAWTGLVEKQRPKGFWAGARPVVGGPVPEY